MTDRFIPTSIIQKLGHNILEIRERALFTLISKLDNGFTFDNDLARSKEVFTKLFEWFLYDPCPHEDIVLSLLKRIILTESGNTLIRHYGLSTVKTELKQVRNCVEAKYHLLVDELNALVENEERKNTSEDVQAMLSSNRVPPLISDIPLSYRSGDSFVTELVQEMIGSAATSVAGYVVKEGSADAQSGNRGNQPSSRAGTYIIERGAGDTPHIDYNISDVLANFTFKWQPLIEADRHVLESVLKSLKHPPQPSALLHSCEFFTDVLLHDFPGELFLQRPSLVLLLQDLLVSHPSTRVNIAVLNCSLQLTKSLQKRINHCNDPCVRNLKEYSLSDSNTAYSSPRSNGRTSLPHEGIGIENAEDINTLKQFEMSTPKYCFTTLKSLLKFLFVRAENVRDGCKKKNQISINTSLMLFEHLLILLKNCVCIEIWNCQPAGVIYDVLKDFNEFTIIFGDLLENYRLESTVNDNNEYFRAVHLCVLHHCCFFLTNFIPPDKSNYILPKCFKNALSHTLLDLCLARLYPQLHTTFLHYVESFSAKSHPEFISKFVKVNKICESMTAAVKFLKTCREISTFKSISLARKGLMSLQFHQDFTFIDTFIDICASKFPLYAKEAITESVNVSVKADSACDAELVDITEDVVLRLLSHHSEEISEYMYRVCQKKVVEIVGPKLNVSTRGISGSEILFLLSGKIFSEIALYGIDSKNIKIGGWAEDILIYILKSKILISEDVWNKIIQALIASFFIVLIHSSKNSTLGRILLNLLDPDTAKDFSIPLLEVIKGNAVILFTEDSEAREEAFSRLIWLLSMQEDAKSFLPRLSNVTDKGLPNACQIYTVTIDVNKTKVNDHFYQASSLNQVMDLLRASDVEPAIRRSALTQVGVMMEDYLLHQIFLENGGLSTILKTLDRALREDDYAYYPDSVIPIIAILKNICFYNTSVRHELSCDINVYYYVLRGLFLYANEDRMRYDASSLLFLLLYSSVITGTPARGNVGVPIMVYKKIRTPFLCHIYGEKSQYVGEQFLDAILSDKWCMSSLQLHWNAEIFDGFQNLLRLDSIDYDSLDNIKVVPQLRIEGYDLKCLKVASIEYSINECLKCIQNGLSHYKVNEAINALITYVYLYGLSKIDKDTSILSYPWDTTFNKYLKLLPSSEDDVRLLYSVIRFLILLVPYYKTSEISCWVINVLKDPGTTILDLINFEHSNDENIKYVSRELLNLITECVCQEQHYLDFYVDINSEDLAVVPSPWTDVIEVVAENLKFNDSQPFYNLAFLDSLLSSLVNLSATLGWSNAKLKGSSKQSLNETISIRGMCELVDAFHYGKGPSAALSVMGLSITRNVMLILNHVLAEMQNSNPQTWDLPFMEDLNETSKMYNFVSLWSSRDVLLRAAVMQFFAGLVTSTRLSFDIINDLKKNKKCLWSMALHVALDHEEASIVRENAVLILANLASHSSSSDMDQITLLIDIGPIESQRTKPVDGTNTVLKLLKNADFFKQFKIMIHCLYTNNLASATNLKIKELSSSQSQSEFSYTYRSASNISDRSWASNDDVSDQTMNLVTPSLIKVVIIFLSNLINLTDEAFVEQLNEYGVIKLIFRCLCYPCMNINNTKDLALYCELLEMNSVICSFLSRTIRISPSSLGTIINTKDCLGVLFTFFDSKVYHTYLPQLFYLRNKLWSEVYSLITSLLEHACTCDKEKSKFTITVLFPIMEAINESGTSQFLETLCESIGAPSSLDLQHSALVCLTLLLQAEYRENSPECGTAKEKEPKTFSLKHLLDTVKPSKSIHIDQQSSELNDAQDIDKNSSKYKMNVLENLYFGSIIRKKEQKSPQPVNNSQSLFAGAQICKLLLHFYDVFDLKSKKENSKKQTLFDAMATILCVSTEAKYYALDHGFLYKIVGDLKDIHVKLSLESVDFIRRIGDRKRVAPVLKDMCSLVGMLTNFQMDNVSVKCEAASLGLADVIHKLWHWFTVQKSFVFDVLRMLSTFTTNCPYACQTMPFTSPNAGTGPRKVANNASLLNAVVLLIGREMEMLSKTHDLVTLHLCFNILQNCCAVIECRVCISKSNVMQSMLRLHPAITKRQKPWESVELMWLQFLQVFTMYPEGQAHVGKLPEIVDLFMTLSISTKPINRQVALLVLQNISFYTPNRVRLLNTDDFINIIITKLETGNAKEKNTVVTIIWALAANNTKAKSIFKSARIDIKLREALKKYQVLEDTSITEEELDRMHYVLDILRDTEKTR